MGRVGQAGREIVLTPAKLHGEGGVQCGDPPWEIFLFVIMVGDD